MAGKTGAEDNINLTAFAHLLNCSAKHAIRTRMECVFDSEENFQKSMLESEQKLSSILPKSILEGFFEKAENVGEENRAKKLSELDLRSLLMLCLSHPTLREHFSTDDKNALTKLNDSVMTLFCMYNGLSADALLLKEIDSVKGDGKDIRGSLKNSILDSLSAVGLSRKEMESKVEELVNGSDSEDIQLEARSFWLDLQSDKLFQLAYLKRAKLALKNCDMSGECLTEELSTAAEKLKAIEKQGSLDLDNFTNIRQTLQKTLDSFLVCGLCKKGLEKPKTLPCLHSHCGDCLKQNLNIADKTVLCPTCQTRVSAPDAQAIESLPCSFVLNGLLNVLLKNLNDATESSIDCSICVQPSILYCIQTGHVFCKDHASSLYQPEHVTLLSGTDLLDVDKLTNLLQSYCPQHRLVLQQFCSTCQVPLCGSSSCISWHAQHGELTSLEDVIQTHKVQLSRLASLLLKKEEKVNQKVQQAEQNQVTVADLQENIRQSVNSYFQDLQDQLEKRKQEFLRDLDRAAELCWHNDEHIRQVLGSWKEKAKELENKFSAVELANESGVHEVARSKGPVSQSAKSPVTNLSVLRQNHLSLLADTAGGGTLRDLKTLSYPEGTLRTLLQTCTNLKSNISAVCGSRGWEVVARQAGLRYFLVNRNQMYCIKKTMFTGCQVLVFDLKDFSSDAHVFCETATRDYQALALNSQGQILIPEETQNNLEFSTMRLKKSVNVATYLVNKERSSFFNVESLNTYNKILFKTVSVSDTVRPNRNNTKIFVGDDQCICELNMEGQTMRKFDFYTMVTIADFTPDPERDILIVTDSVKHNLLIFNCRQQQMVAIGGQGATPGSFSFPSGVCLDSFGHVFVADPGNSRIQILDLAGKFLKLLPYPQSLKEVSTAPNAAPNSRVIIQAHEDYVYMFDSKMDIVWRMKYI